MTLTVGHISYLNCAPLFHFLPETGFSGRVVQGVPAELNRQLEGGFLDLCPSSSFEYARNWRDYLLLPGQSISSCGPVRSVLLLSPCPIEDLDGQEIALTGESLTSVNLLKIILKEFEGHHRIACRVPQEPVEDLLGAGQPALLIGDRALRAAGQKSPATHIYDLGELWLRHTGLPFVFALWIVRRGAALKKREELRTFLGQLAESRSRAFASLEALAEATPEKAWMGGEGLVDYWETMSYDLGPAHLEGLRLFFNLSVRMGLLDEEPEINFFQ
ncbi:MAG: futalosine synthase [Desulfuromonas sp.]|uniref:menaquinone biosynthetic enzyme MqnA/MqnD family protein n=1 Tax=Desulfuromonas sp. TaxID=892 RepID=UPI000CAA080A|nr:menaquinone biosynthesis protein [Desulfuromonas sp.]PLX85749.1 MAG: futalosine synthase [Desulfuromonas sp.]